LSSTVTASGRDFEKDNSEFFSIASNSTLQLSNTNFAYVCWFKFESMITTGSGNGLIWKDGEVQFGQFRTGGQDRLYFGVIFDDATSAFVNLSATTLSTGTWYMLYGYHDADNNLIGVSLNAGTPATAATSGKVPVTGTSVLNVGKNISSSDYMDGVLQSLSFYKGSLPDVSSLYNSGSGKLYKDLTAGEKTDLVSWWDCAETSGVLIDAHGTNHLTDNNTVTSAAGKVTYTAEDASDFERTNTEFLSIADGSQSGLGFSGHTSFYVACWIKIESFTAYDGLVSKWKYNGGVSSQLSWILGIRNNARVWCSVSSNGTTWTHKEGTQAITSTGEWYFIQMYHDASADVIAVSVNNQAFETAAHSTGVFNSTAAFLIGAQDDAAGRNAYDGLIQQVVIVSGIPSAAERTALYGRGFGCDVSDRPTLSSATYVSWWKLDEASGTRYDSIGSNDLTDNNTVTGGDGVVYNVPAVATGQYMTMNAGFW
jgi:hypothetical protein